MTMTMNPSESKTGWKERMNRAYKENAGRIAVILGGIAAIGVILIAVDGRPYIELPAIVVDIAGISMFGGGIGALVARWESARDYCVCGSGIVPDWRDESEINYCSNCGRQIDEAIVSDTPVQITSRRGEATREPTEADGRKS